MRAFLRVLRNWIWTVSLMMAVMNYARTITNCEWPLFKIQSSSEGRASHFVCWPETGRNEGCSNYALIFMNCAPVIFRRILFKKRASFLRISTECWSEWIVIDLYWIVHPFLQIVYILLSGDTSYSFLGFEIPALHPYYLEIH